MTEQQSRDDRGDLIECPDDPRLDPYRELRYRNPTRFSGIFIAEGRLTTLRLLASDLRTISVLVDAERQHLLPTDIAPGVEILRVPHDLVRRLVGYNFHRGLIACGQRRPVPRLMTVAGELFAQPPQPRLDVMLCGVSDPENVGVIVRTAAAFGVDSLILGPGTADPFGRRALRVSMGNIFNVPLYESRTPAADISMLGERFRIRSIATTLSDKAIALDQMDVPGSRLLVLGNEYEGIPPDVVSACRDQVCLPMSGVVDSLNVAVAAGIFLYHFRHQNRGG